MRKTQTNKTQKYNVSDAKYTKLHINIIAKQLFNAMPDP